MASSTYMVQSPPMLLDSAAKVKELIDHDRKGWNVHLLDDIFNEEDHMAIKGIPISSSNQPDRLVWRGMKNGIFFGEHCLSYGEGVGTRDPTGELH